MLLVVLLHGVFSFTLDIFGSVGMELLAVVIDLEEIRRVSYNYAAGR